MPFESGIGVQKWDCLKIKKSIHYGSMEIYLQCISKHTDKYILLELGPYLRIRYTF